MKKKLWIIVLIIVIASVLITAIAIVLTANPIRINPDEVNNVCWYSNIEDDTTPNQVSEEETLFILDIINTSRKHQIPEAYRPTFDGLYRVYYVVDITLKDGNASYSLLLYHHKDWSLFSGETEYKLALTRTDGDGESIWGLSIDSANKLTEWIYSNRQ